MRLKKEAIAEARSFSRQSRRDAFGKDGGIRMTLLKESERLTQISVLVSFGN
jgi:hypothetical protein